MAKNDPRRLPEKTHVGHNPDELRSPKEKPNPVTHPHLQGDDRTATEGEPQRGEPGSDARKPPTTEHVEGDVSTRVNQGLPPDKTDTEKDAEKKADKKPKSPHPSLKKG